MACMHERLNGATSRGASLACSCQSSRWELIQNPSIGGGDSTIARSNGCRPDSSWASPSARVVLFPGRLSFHSKAHPLPLYRPLNDSALITSWCYSSVGTSSTPARRCLRPAGTAFSCLTRRRLGGLAASEEESWPQQPLTCSDPPTTCRKPSD